MLSGHHALRYTCVYAMCHKHRFLVYIHMYMYFAMSYYVQEHESFKCFNECCIMVHVQWTLVVNTECLLDILTTKNDISQSD